MKPLPCWTRLEPNEAQIELIIRGMETLVGLLGNVMSGLGEEKH